jgi:hypothetical protein
MEKAVCAPREIHWLWVAMTVYAVHVHNALRTTGIGGARTRSGIVLSYFHFPADFPRRAYSTRGRRYVNLLLQWAVWFLMSSLCIRLKINEWADHCNKDLLRKLWKELF